MPRLLRLTCLLYLLIVAGSGHALTDVRAAVTSQPLASELAWLEDRDHALGLREALALPAGAWQRNDGDSFNRGYSASTWWLRLDMHADADVAGTRLLDIGYPALDTVEAWVLAGDRVLAHHVMGDAHPFANRPVPHRHPLLPVALTPGETRTVLLRVRSGSAVQAPLSLWTPTAFFEAEQARLLGHGLYFGTVGVMAIYNLFVCIVLRSRSYLYYVGSVASMAAFLASLNGLSYQYLWPDDPVWENQAIVIALAGIVVFRAPFTVRLLRLDKHLPLLRRVLLGMAALSGVIILATLVRPDLHLVQEGIIIATASCLTCLLAGCVRWYRGDSIARLYTLAWSAMLFGGILMALNKFNVLPQNVFTENALQIGSALEVILLSFALAERLNLERRLRFEAQQEALATQRLANETLEHRVAERTAELEAANRKLAELSATDALTGLRNRRHLDRVLHDAFAHSLRHGHALAVLLVDIDHFKRFNDTHGHHVGDDCLRAVASRLEASRRHPGDTIARYGGEEFCLVLQETDLAGAAAMAERIRGEVEAMAFVAEGVAVPVTVSIGVTARVPVAGDSVAQWLQEADAALYASKTAGRNRVTLAAPAGDAVSAPA